ncbi:SMP-30/gluconolactonase/LRE family protein [Halocynthiibacter sp. C4]|uniref:SMP-30/gluconolactonase/LRE family protein n=1 Tax=Halocynthiibacter sp. C4 TaxID=2992758 RepID=UPI00237BFA2A|nr:SMP-30/gluconolactonase/LRE family protein [Halocynthiibacter sp. C4]MDE0591566.1 SMP-30/gluconolactonase/LRE family protein [Halocynthiibacter sp. C4]
MSQFDDVAKRFPGAGTLVKGIQILEYLAARKQPCTSTELLKQTELPKATLYRLLGAMVEFGFVRHDKQNKVYALGHRLIELGRETAGARDLRSAAEYELSRLAEELNETVSFAVMEKDRTIHVDVRQPENPLAVKIDIGRNFTAVGSASGQAILASLPPHKVNPFLAGMPEDERAKLLASFAISRARGYTISESKTIEGVLIIAVPVFGPSEMGNGAIVVTALADRIPLERRHVIGRDLMEAARRVMGNIGSAPVSITPNPRRSRHVDEALTCVCPVGAIVGEGPVWDHRTNLLYWVDVTAPAFHVFDPETGKDHTANSPHLVSAVLPCEGGGMLAISQNGVERYNPITNSLQEIYDPEAHMPSNRFNDAKTDRKGRIWAGTMSLDAAMPSGSLYCFDNVSSARAMDGGMQVSNGMGWSPDDKTFYFVDSALGTVFAYDFDLESGGITGKRNFLVFPPDEGKPDGLCVDSAGNIWVALWDGWRVACYDPNGNLLREIDMPVPRPTSVCLGGKDLKTLYITSASIRLPADVLEEAPLSGGLFSVEVDVPGQQTVEVKL